jgi:hypothetical protein
MARICNISFNTKFLKNLVPFTWAIMALAILNMYLKTKRQNGPTKWGIKKIEPKGLKILERDKNVTNDS